MRADELITGGCRPGKQEGCPGIRRRKRGPMRRRRRRSSSARRFRCRKVKGGERRRGTLRRWAREAFAVQWVGYRKVDPRDGFNVYKWGKSKSLNTEGKEDPRGKPRARGL